MSEQWRPGETRIFGLPNRAGVPLLILLTVATAVLGLIGWVTGALLAILTFIALSILVALSYMTWLPPRFWLGRNLPPYSGRDAERR